MSGTLLFFSGCAALFGWDIHAPGLLSEDFSRAVQPIEKRVALYVDPNLLTYESKERGGKTADPQTYHVGEAFGPMMVEGFQDAFSEFIFLETQPTPQILRRYGITCAVAVRLKDFGNQVSWKGQAILLATEVVLFDGDLQELDRFEATGTSDARKVFAKKGGPEVNLNAAIESNVQASVHHLQDFLRTKT